MAYTSHLMSESKPQTITFADVSGSTKLFEVRGDVDARRLIAAILDALAEVTTQHGGRVIKTIGDEIMCTFPGAVQGLLAVVDMQKRIALDPVFAQDRLAIRIGLHHGDALMEDDDVYGDAVNTAARVASLAKREQIITTASTIKMLSNAGMLHTRSVGEARVSGKRYPIEIVEVMWQEDTSNVTMVQRAIRLDTDDADTDKLILTYRGRVLELDPLSPVFTLGRDPNSSLVVEGDWVSRNHAAIEYKRGYFVISDRSMNGTYVKLGEDDELRLHRDETQLRKTGIISLGQTMAENPDNLLAFQCGD